MWRQAGLKKLKFIKAEEVKTRKTKLPANKTQETQELRDNNTEGSNSTATNTHTDRNWRLDIERCLVRIRVSVICMRRNEIISGTSYEPDNLLLRTSALQLKASRDV